MRRITFISISCLVIANIGLYGIRVGDNRWLLAAASVAFLVLMMGIARIIELLEKK